MSVTATAHVTDNLSGVTYAAIEFVSPNGEQFRGAKLELVSGTNLDGVYEAKVTFARFSQAGAWKVIVRLQDAVNNYNFMQSPQLEAKGFPAAISVKAVKAVPTVTSISPASGPESGKTVVSITGTGFATGAGTEVFFGKHAATNVLCASSTSCTVESPLATKLGLVDVRARVAGKTSKKNIADRFTYG